MYILGVSALYHDAAAALIKDGEILAAVQEERFTRKKHDMRLPVNAINYLLKYAGISQEDLECVVYYDNPKLTLDRFMQNVLAMGKASETLLNGSYPSIFGEKLWVHDSLKRAVGGLGKRGKLLVSEHHISHAASAFYPSPFEDAVILTIDGVGEWATTTIGVGHGNKLELKQEIDYPHSLGLLYSAFTYFCGFKVNSGDYKFMGLAPYGKPVYYDAIKKEIIEVKADGSYQLNLEYFDYYKGKTMINEEKFSELFNGPRRVQESEITKREMDIAASVQLIIEEIIIKIVRHAKEEYGQGINNLVLAGGVALNCVANGKILKEKIFDHIWVQPAAGDAGGAVGCALYAYYSFYNNQRIVLESDSQKGSYLDPAFSNETIRNYLDINKFPYHFIEKKEELYKTVGKELCGEKVIGLFNGAMEFGPRALGNRSIIADPRSSQMQSKLNLKIKYRESFRPFAPAVLEERYQDYFEIDAPSPYMLLVDEVKKEKQLPFDLDEFLTEENTNLLPIINRPRSDVPAITHVDYSARIQTVSPDRNPNFYHIIKAFEDLSGCGVVVNTSFNVRGEPIVCTPQEAYECFMRTEMDVLVLENCILYKEEQPKFVDREDWREKYELD